MLHLVHGLLGRTPCSLVHRDHGFGGTCYLHIQYGIKIVRKTYTIQIIGVTESSADCFFDHTWHWLIRISPVSFMRYRKPVGLSLIQFCINDTSDFVEQTPLLFTAISQVRQRRIKKQWGQYEVCSFVGFVNVFRVKMISREIRWENYIMKRGNKMVW
jgi:hypothetical protein